MSQSKYTKPQKAQRLPIARAGFTLIELLSVVTLMLVLVGIATPFLSRFMGPANFTQNVTKVSILLEQARQHAVTQNTYVWVAFCQSSGGANPAYPEERIAVAILASTDGTNPFDWSSPTTASVPSPTQNIALISKLEWLKSTRIEDTSAVSSFGTTAKKPTHPGVELYQNLTFLITPPGSSSPLEFDRVLVFSPQGDARVSDSPVAFADFALQPMRGNQDDQSNFAIFQISGLTGLSRIYRQ
jgi:prepilin-type N-terminal cleavage/methylation domain-containing protein